MLELESPIEPPEFEGEFSHVDNFTTHYQGNDNDNTKSEMKKSMYIFQWFFKFFETLGILPHNENIVRE